MDKYTVDLDQVLNDFEYSELTDHHSKNVPERGSVPFQPAPVTKHSINNVLHSLNEYLNSEINSSSVNDNNLQCNISRETIPIGLSIVENSLLNDSDKGETVIIEDDVENGDSQSNSVDSNKTELYESPIKQINVENSVLECDKIEIEKADSLLENDRENEHYANPDNHIVENITNEALSESEGILIEIGDSEVNSTETEECIEPSSETKTEKDLGILSNEEQIDDSSNIETVVETNTQANIEETSKDVPTECLIEEHPTSEIPEATLEIVEAPEKDEIPIEEVVEGPEKGEIPIEEVVEGLEKGEIPIEEVIEAPEKCETPIEEVVLPIEEVVEAPEKGKTLIEEVVVAHKEDVKKVVGFSANVDIDEEDLNKMLEDLELEHMELDVVDKSMVVETEKGNNEATKRISESHLEETKDVEKLEDKTSVAIEPKLENDMTSFVPEQPQVIECMEMEKPRDKPVAKSITTTSNEIKEEELVKSDELVEDEQKQEPISRPQDLPLNNQSQDEAGGRKINLIGSPGSTPYNNVYINKSVDSKPIQDESDYASSSPTFSDCSTESTSTASTVSVDDAPDKFTRRAMKVKNTNADSENMSKELAGKEAGSEEVVQESADNDNEGSAGDSRVQSTEPRADTFLDKSWLGKEAPLWIPDADAPTCLHCETKFTVIKRRHHCRACGLVLCSKCCNLKFRLEYLDAEARVCNKCFEILSVKSNETENNSETGNSNPPGFRPNPNNPLEYCSTVSPLQQAGQTGAPPPSVMVPVGVLKRKGSSKKSNKSVMFCDGIAPGSDLTILDQDFNYNSDSKQVPKNPEETKAEEVTTPPSLPPKASRNQPKIDEDTGCFIPKSETSLPPTVTVNKTETLYSDCSNSPSVVEMLKNEALTFAVNQNLFVQVQIVNMSCCINKHAWCFSTEGLINVGSDEIVYLIEYIDEESFVPKDVFFHIYNVYLDAVKGVSIKEQGLSLHNTSNFLDSKNHAGFVYVKPSFQCLENLLVPKEPYLIGILIHRWETPWAKLFPLRLILRLGAEYRYYPSPLISTRHRDSVFVEIGHTIVNLLADFRNFTYTLPQIRGLIIHMEDKKTTITIPRNRYDQVMKSINDSSEHILAFAGNFSSEADSHLVCIQDTQGHENCYTTHAINIHNKPRKITGASFIVFNGSLKSTSGLTAKSNIVEDGLMIQIPSEHMDKIRDNLRNMKNHSIACGCIDAASDETVNIIWGENDVDFNIGVKSPVDLSDMKGVPSIRVHNGKDYFCNNGTRLIRWTEVFILQNGEESPRNQDPVDVSKVSESVAKACCTALVKYLDLLVSNGCQKIGIRATLHVENVSYSAGSDGSKLAPIYMRSLDNKLIPVLHRLTSNELRDNSLIIELIFRILNA